MMMMMLFSRVLGVRCVFFSSRVSSSRRGLCVFATKQKKILGEKRRHLGHNPYKSRVLNKHTTYSVQKQQTVKILSREKNKNNQKLRLHGENHVIIITFYNMNKRDVNE